MISFGQFKAKDAGPAIARCLCACPIAITTALGVIRSTTLLKITLAKS